MAWKPSVMTPTKVKEFKDAFSMGFSKAEACLYCEVAESTFFDYCSKHEEFTSLIPTLQNLPKLKAKMNILTKLNEWDDYNSRWLLEKTDKEFNPKHIVDQNLTWELKMPDVSFNIINPNVTDDKQENNWSEA